MPQKMVERLGQEEGSAEHNVARKRK